MNKKLKIALRSCSSEQGFAIPVAVGIGLVMLLVGVTMIIRSQGDQVTASAQKATARSLNAAEAGITRVQSVMNTYRILSNITLTNIASTPPTTSWNRVYNASPPSCSTAGSTEISSYRINSDWITLDNGGQFRIKEYTYRPNSDPAKITVGTTIPFSGSVALAILPINYLIDNDSVEGQIQGIPGILSRQGNNYTFRRLGSGTSTPIATDTFFFPGPSDPPQNTGDITIPVSGSVPITILPATYLLDGGSVEGQIEGIQGTLFRSGSVYTFERLVSGAATNVTGDFFPTRAPGTGTLRLEGRVNQAGTGNTATQTVGTANSQLVVSIPIMQRDINSLPVPGTWLKSGTMIGNQKVQGNILLNDCSISTPSPTDHQAIDNSQSPPGPYIDPDTGMPYKTLRVDSVFPPLPRKPTFITSPMNQILGTLNSNQTFPRTGDTSNTGAVYPAIGGVFEYSVTSVTGNNTITILTNPGIQVRFYLDGNIDKQTTFLHNCSTSSCKPTDFEIIGYGPSGSTICLNGNGLIDGFIYAPAYSAGVDGNGKFRGSVWVNDFDAPSCSSSSNHIVVDQTANWTTLGLKPRNLPPTLAPVTSWLRQEASP
jgi:hypothetical protein